MGIKAPDTDLNLGELEAENYKYVVEEIFKQNPKLKYVAITLRGSISASYNTWSAVF